jgi:aryl-alcohol dehydrogenase-like predicted oxidoreductase
MVEKRKLGETEFHITAIGLGTWAIGGEWQYGWGPQNDAESVAAIRYAVDSGINWIDTAAVYGLGHAEQMVTRALKELGSRRRPYVFTKCSLVWDAKGNVSHSLKRDSIRRECENSLKRLETEVLDLYQVHWPAAPGETANNPTPDLEEGWSAMAELQREGKVRYIGVSNFNVAQMERARRIAPISSLQPPYSMLMRDIEDEVLPYCRRYNIGVIAYSPMHSGLLTGSMTRERLAKMASGDWRRNSPSFQEPAFSRALELVEVLREIGKRHGRTPAEVAVAWTLRRPEVSGAIVGARRPEQVDGFIGALEFRLGKDELEEIQRALPEQMALI